MVFQGVGQQLQYLTNLGNAFFRQPLLVQGIALHEMLFEDVRRPGAELGAAFGVDPVADRNYGIKIEPFNGTPDLSITFFLNCCIFCNSGLSIFGLIDKQFSLFGCHFLLVVFWVVNIDLDRFYRVFGGLSREGYGGADLSFYG
jgi:hypothetical protein